jgi:fructokinase
MSHVFAGIEAGGSKFVCAVSEPGGKIIKKISIPTTTSDETIPQVIKFFQTIDANTPISAMGIASFGPVDLDQNSPTYGHITATPKPGWRNFDFVGTMRKVFNLPIGFDTDVNGSALGEYNFGAARGLDTFIYVTVGTGIGAGGMVSGKLMHGLVHPEMGHMFVPHDKTSDPFPGVCPYHGDCLEGLASGPALQKRWNIKTPSNLPPDHPAWELEAKYLALAFANCILTLSPQKIILGGGVTKQAQLYPKIQEKVVEFLHGYIKHEKILEQIDSYIVPPGLGDDAGILGALALAENRLPPS